MQFPLQIIHTQETQQKNYLENNPDRCYLCKADLFKTMEKLKISLGYHYVLDGCHAQDNSAERLGMLASQQYGVMSPLRASNFTKSDVRQLSKKLGLLNWDKPSSPCLASRFPTGVKIQVNQFEVLEKIESICKNAGFPHVRARHHQEILRLEIPPDQLASFIQKSPQILPLLQALPYRYITLDLQGLRMEALR